jgi:hypothetical protein
MMRKISATKEKTGSSTKREATKRRTYTSAKRRLVGASRIKAVVSSETSHDIISSPVSDREKIALMAYTYWEQRGCQGGSSDEDWYRAEREITAITQLTGSDH